MWFREVCPSLIPRLSVRALGNEVLEHLGTGLPGMCG